MQDLRRNALKEYEEVRAAELAMVRKERKIPADSKEVITQDMLKNSQELNHHYLTNQAHQSSSLLSQTNLNAA